MLLKLSGEALMGTSQFGINKKTIDSIVEEIKQVYDLGVGLAIVILSLIHISEPTRPY